MKRQDKGPKPVANIVNSLLEDARKSRSDGPSSPLYGARAQLSTTLNQAGTLLAKLDRDVPPAPRSSLLQTVLGFSAAKPVVKKRSWFFASAEPQGNLNARKIEQLLKAASKDGKRLMLDTPPVAKSADAEDVHCVLPEGAADPVCEPRK